MTAEERTEQTGAAIGERPRRARLREALEQHDPERIIAILEELATPARRRRLDEVLSARLGSVTVVMDAPHDPHNGAAVIRSADAFGVCRVHVVERHEVFSVASAVAKGTERWVDVVTHASVAGAVECLRADDFVLVGTHPEGAMTPAALGDVPRLALVMGNEHDGICAELAAACSQRVRIPMRGFVESLNVSVSAAILLSYATGQRAGDLPGLERRRWYAWALVQSVPRALDILAARGLAIRPGS
jgi:tRNA (guanosine-2'-O-)-methyltransferase